MEIQTKFGIPNLVTNHIWTPVAGITANMPINAYWISYVYIGEWVSIYANVGRFFFHNLQLNVSIYEHKSVNKFLSIP